jgi:hypothetical protein
VGCFPPDTLPCIFCFQLWVSYSHYANPSCNTVALFVVLLIRFSVYVYVRISMLAFFPSKKKVYLLSLAYIHIWIYVNCMGFQSTDLVIFFYIFIMIHIYFFVWILLFSTTTCFISSFQQYDNLSYNWLYVYPYSSVSPYIRIARLMSQLSVTRNVSNVKICTTVYFAHSEKYLGSQTASSVHY